MKKKLLFLLLAIIGMTATAQTEQIYSMFTATGGTAGYNNQSYGCLVDGKCTSAYFSKWCLAMSNKTVLAGQTEGAVYCEFSASRPIEVTKYILTTGEDNVKCPNRNPKRWVLQAKQNSGDNWVTVDSVFNDTVLKDVNYENYEFTMANPGTYQYFRFLVYENKGDDSLQLGELRLKGPLQTATLAGAGTESNPFIIPNVAGWNTFATNVNAGVNADKYYKLADSFVDSTPVTVMAGTETNPFTGHFNGNGKTLYVNISGTEQAAAPFSYINGATIEMLTVAGTVTSTAYHAAGLVGLCRDDNANTIQYCTVETNVIGTGYAGGIIGHGGNGNLTMSNCVYSGTISNFVNFAGGLLGWCDKVKVTMTDCLFKGSFSPGSGGKYHPIACHTNGQTPSATCTNVYYTGNDATAASNYWVSGANGLKVTSSMPSNTICLIANAADGNSYYCATSVSGVESFYEFTGSVIHPVPTVKLPDGTTVGSNCYTVTYSGDETTPGNYSVSISGVSAEGYEGTTTINYDVNYQKPTNLTVSLTSGNGTIATLSWTENGTATQWQLQYGTNEAFSAGSYVETTVSGIPSKALTELTAETIYYARVRSVYGDGESQWSSVINFQPTDKFIIGSGTATSSYLPTYTYYNYSLTEQIYTASEIGSTSGHILSIDFYNTGAARTRNMDIYMVGTTKDTFADGNDFEAVSSDNLVFSGEVTFAENLWTTINLDTPFAYDGIMNLLLVVDDNTGSYQSTVNFRVFDATGRAVRVYSDGTNYDPTTPSYSGALLNVKNQIRLDITSAAVCAKPASVTISNITDESAVVSWTSSASAWTLRYREVGASTWTTVNVPTTSYTITGLDAATEYEVQVQTNCGGGDTSDWTTVKTFTTEMCPLANQGTIRYELADSYGDGWEGSKIQVVHVNSGYVAAELTIASGSSAEGAFKLCCGEDYDFVWVSNSSWDSECSYVFYDINDDEIFSGSGALSTFTYTMNCSSCQKPKDLMLTAEPTTSSASLIWMRGSDDQTMWDLAYKAEGDADFTLVEELTDTTYTLTGLQEDTKYTVKVRANCGGGDVSVWSKEVVFTTDVAFPAPENMKVSDVEPHSAVVSWEAKRAKRFNLRYKKLDASALSIIMLKADDVWGDGTGYQMLLDADATAYGDVIPAIDSGIGYLDDAGVYAQFEYKIPENADGELTTSNIVLDDSVTIMIPPGTYDWCITNPTPGDRLWIASSNGSIAGRADDYVFEPAKIYKFHTYMGNNGNDAVELTVTDNPSAVIGGDTDWTIVNNVTTPYSLTGLDAACIYAVQVQCVYDDGMSQWSFTTFVTPEENPVPFNVDVTEGHTSAYIAWKGFGDSYNVKYREEGTEDWTTVNTTEKSISITGLDPVTTYEYQIQSVKGVETSDWTTLDTFTTLSQKLAGDVNDDARFSIADVTMAVNLIKAGGYDAAADLNGDNVVDENDLDNLVNVKILDIQMIAPVVSVKKHQAPKGTPTQMCKSKKIKSIDKKIKEEKEQLKK